MKNLIKNFFLFVSFTLTNVLYAQVGINTTDPKSTLDINGNLKVRNVTTLSSINSNHTVLLRDKTATTGDFEIKEINSDFLVVSNGNANAYYASKTGSWSLINLALGGSWYKINLTGTSDTKLGAQSLFTDGVYTAQQAGIYAINYEFQFTAGIDLDLLGGKRLGIIKNGTTVWDEKIFDGIRLNIIGIITIASVPVTSTNLSSLVQLAAGDTITFAVNTGGLLPINLGVLTNAKVNVYIYKVSN
ncbi:MAG: hypothetical protein DI529_02870 [Chryseobacterium sp.]|nr:MAG: hypothetical protein DI529_02870 [Chryseobacterium sp.]